LSHTLIVLFPYPPAYLQLAFIHKIRIEAIMEWMGNTTAETSNLLSLFKELGLMHYLTAVSEQTVTRAHSKYLLGSTWDQVSIFSQNHTKRN